MLKNICITIALKKRPKIKMFQIQYLWGYWPKIYSIVPIELEFQYF